MTLSHLDAHRSDSHRRTGPLISSYRKGPPICHLPPEVPGGISCGSPRLEPHLGTGDSEGFQYSCEEWEDSRPSTGNLTCGNWSQWNNPPRKQSCMSLQGLSINSSLENAPVDRRWEGGRSQDWQVYQSWSSDL